MGRATKREGKTEVYPFWNMEDIKGMIDYFQEHEMWHWYMTFMFGLLLGRRVSDTLTLKWSDFYYENGRMKDEINLRERKTGKLTRPYVCGACKNAIVSYIEKTGINPMDNYDDFVIPTKEKSILLSETSGYEPEDFQTLLDKAVDTQAAAYRKQFKKAAEFCNIKYPVSTHSTRKTFGYWSVQLHPYDVTTIDKLQGMFGHTDRNTTLHYVGIAREDEIKLYKDMGDFITDVAAGKSPVIKNSPVISLKNEDFRNLLSKCFDLARSGADKFDVLNELIGQSEQLVI